MILAPIILFTYKRLDTLKLTVDALKKNYLAKDSHLFIFSDAAKGEKDRLAVKKVRAYLQMIEGFKSVQIHQEAVNKGLANSIIYGVSKVLETNEYAIVLEDDLITSPNFLKFMNDSLLFYKNDKKIFSITGFSIPIKNHSRFDNYFTKRSSSWGWATWNDRWTKIDWSVKTYKSFKKDYQLRNKFNLMGSDMASMLDKQMNGKIDSWAIRWCYNQFLFDMYSVHPYISKIQNIGFTPDASHTTDKFNRYKTYLDNGNQTEFSFSEDVSLDKNVIKQFTKPFSLLYRIKFKLINLVYIK